MEFSQVSYKTMPGNPAQVDRKTGQLFINPILWENMPESFQRFILLHEEGHLKGGPNGGPTADETAADLYAFRQYKNTEPNSLKNSVIALDSILGNSEQETKRKLIIYSAALLEDWQHNKNAKALVEYHNIKGELEKYHGVDFLPVVNSDKSNFIQAVIGLVVAAAGYYVKNQAAVKAREAQATYDTSYSTQMANANLQAIYEMEKQNDKAAQNAVITKYVFVISIILSIAFIVYWYYFKKKA